MEGLNDILLSLYLPSNCCAAHWGTSTNKYSSHKLCCLLSIRQRKDINLKKSGVWNIRIKTGSCLSQLSDVKTRADDISSTAGAVHTSCSCPCVSSLFAHIIASKSVIKNYCNSAFINICLSWNNKSYVFLASDTTQSKGWRLKW